MNGEESRAEGWLAGLRRSGDSVLGLLQSRLELFGVELQEEKLRAISLLIWLSIAIGLGMAGLLVAIGALALLLWKSAGYLGLAGLAIVTLGAAAAILWFLRRRLINDGPPFGTTVGEFKKDRECLKRLL